MMDCLSLFNGTKSTFIAGTNMFIEVFVDGASKGQGRITKDAEGNEVRAPGGEAACAVIIYKNKKEVVRYARGLGYRTNNEAEYEAVLTALLICVMSDFELPVIYSDSQVVVNQVNGVWRCNTDSLLPLLLSIREIQENYHFRLQHVKRDFVSEADALAKNFLGHLNIQKDRYRNEGRGS